MAYAFSCATGLLPPCALGIEAAAALILSAANGLSGLLKDALVLCAAGFPLVTLIVIWSMLASADPPI